MALPTIETGYKPEFGLGAVYQGFNAANAEQGAELELIKQFLANQREQSMQPMDINIKQTESDYATMKRAADYMDAAKRGYIGQMNSQDAAGRKAMETAQGDIDLTNAGNRNKLTTEQLLSRLNDLKKTKIEGGGIGFQMQQPEQPAGTGFNWQVSPQEQQQRDLGRIGILRQEKQLYPNDPNLAKELQLAEANIDKTPSVPQAVNANNSPLVPLPPKRNGGITQGGPEYEAVMQALVDTPDLRQKLLLGDQRLDSAEYQKILALQEAEKRRAGAGGKDPYLEFYKLSPEKRLGVMEWAINSGINPVTREPFRDGEADKWVSMYNQDLATYNARNASNAKEGSIPLTELTEGKIPTRPAVTAGTPKATAAQPQPTQMTYAEVSKLYPGVPEAKIKEAYKKKFGVDLK